MKKFLAVIAAAFCILTVLNTAHTAGKDEAEKKGTGENLHKHAGGYS